MVLNQREAGLSVKDIMNVADGLMHQRSTVLQKSYCIIWCHLWGNNFSTLELGKSYISYWVSSYLAMNVRYRTTDNLQLDKVNILTGIIRVFVVHSALTTSLPIFCVYVLNHNENFHHWIAGENLNNNLSFFSGQTSTFSP